jgi:hypothetical protein
VVDTRRSYTGFVGAVYEAVRGSAGDDARVAHHQPADRMIEFVVSAHSDVLRRTRRLPPYVWREADPGRVAQDILEQYHALAGDARDVMLARG